jgi:fructoselysine-6-P-deglycase FrlB-like protein
VSWFESELREQPQALACLLENQAERVDELAAAFRAADVRYILIASRGSSSNAARYAQYLLGRARTDCLLHSPRRRSTRFTSSRHGSTAHL